MNLRRIPLLLLALAVASPLWSQQYEIIEDGPIHEAFVTHVQGNIILEAISQRPPEPMRENIPGQWDDSAVWIRGYWSWSSERNDFVWVSGVWRRPPPGHEWIEGFWEQYEEGWVWVPGFWSSIDERDLQYIQIQPPDPVDEQVDQSQTSNFFWNPGYWMYQPEWNSYEWVSGGWEEWDPNWILIPAHYTWRPEGYVFIPAYWDWPFDSLGQAYECAYIEPQYRGTIIFVPEAIIELPFIIERCFYYYPDYLCFYYHHFHYHPGFWVDYCCAPHWWLWNSWWCLPWQHQWGLWWWYTHPGFPHPLWLTAQLSQMLPKPPELLLKKIKDAAPPKFLTPEGFIPPQSIVDEISKITGNKNPILPANPKERENIIDRVRPPKVPDILRPSGKPLPFDPTLKRPIPGKPQATPGTVPKPPSRIKPQIPPPPSGPQLKPPALRPMPRPPVYRPSHVPPPPGQRKPIDRPYGPPDSTPPPSIYAPPPTPSKPIYRPPVYKPSRPSKPIDRTPELKPQQPQKPSYRPPVYQPPPRTDKPEAESPIYYPKPVQKPPKPSYRPPTFQPPPGTDKQDKGSPIYYPKPSKMPGTELRPDYPRESTIDQRISPRIPKWQQKKVPQSDQNGNGNGSGNNSGNLNIYK